MTRNHLRVPVFFVLFTLSHIVCSLGEPVAEQKGAASLVTGEVAAADARGRAAGSGITDDTVKPLLRLAETPGTPPAGAQKLPSSATCSPPPSSSKSIPPETDVPSKPGGTTAAGLRRPFVPAGVPGSSFSEKLLTEDVVWRGEVLIEGPVTIAPQTTLTIEAGTVVRFRAAPSETGSQAVLLVQGRIVASGTAEKPVIFTSALEDPRPGDWQGIVFLASEKKNILENCRIEGADTGVDAMFSTLTIKNTVFVKCQVGAAFRECLVVMAGGGASACTVGARLTDSEVDMRDAEFSGSRRGIEALRTSLYLSGCSVKNNRAEGVTAEASRIRFAGNSFIANGCGVHLLGCEGTVSANRILKNGDYGLSLAGSRVKVNGNEIAQNAAIGMRVEDGMGIAWGNILSANGEYDLFNAGSEEFRAVGNWWGEGAVADLGKRIYGRHMDNNRGGVRYVPFLHERPQMVP